MRQVFLLQNTTVITKCGHFITKCDVYYKMRRYRYLQIDLIISKQQCLWLAGVSNVHVMVTTEFKIGFQKTELHLWLIVITNILIMKISVEHSTLYLEYHLKYFQGIIFCIFKKHALCKACTVISPNFQV